uniref:R2R3 MYB transcription factor DUO POLLEN 1 n=1 Tax=Haplomitrium mnioides TaxID=56921 RepID=A0A3G9ESP1_9MARC|nr:R2R3 MYB transcription factor DUO POLLEN 1 [Haplomitrium mnioides]
MKTVQNGDEVLRKGPWMPEEDEILVEYVRQCGARDWSSIRSKGLLPRTGKSCRLRWVNKLKPDLKRSGCKFSPEEEKLVVEMQAKLGNKWAKIASCLPGRTDNDVKNFWSTRQKRILRALQRPKMPSGSTDAAADTSDLSKDPSLNDFGAFQVQSPSGTGLLVPSGFVPPFLFEEDSAFREAPGHMRLRHSVQPFSSLDVDDVLSLKLQDMVAGDAHFTDSDFTQTGRALTDDVRHSSVMYQHSPHMVTTRNARSVKRRPRSRRDGRTCFEHHPGTDGGPESVQMLPDIGIPLIQNGNREFGVPLSEQQNNNYLDFLLHSETSCMQSNQILSPELPSFLTSSHQWEKLPMLYSDDPSIQESGKDSDSCSPDSVISGFAADVFDSLEPLCPAPSEWWVARLT